jgi:hypothetical protein
LIYFRFEGETAEAVSPSSAANVDKAAWAISLSNTHFP